MPEELNLSNLKPAAPRKDRKRVGRGMGSGKGRYSGRGIKGQKSRSGSHKMRAGFEGGQMPIYMRLGKQRGPYSKDAMPMGPHRTQTVPVNIRDLDRFDDGAEVTPEALVEAGLIKNTRAGGSATALKEVKPKRRRRKAGKPAPQAAAPAAEAADETPQAEEPEPAVEAPAEEE
jgi:large subunit ribosomal protein L15